MIRIKKGLDIPVSGKPVQEIAYGPAARSVALVADDYVGLRPAMKVAEGERVRLGQVLLTDKQHPDIGFTSPGCGRVTGVHRAEKRRLVSVTIELDGDDQEPFPTCNTATATGDEVRRLLMQSGLWTALRTRPFNRIPDPASEPDSIFVTAMDTNPLAADPTVVLAQCGDDFVLGLQLLTRLAPGGVLVCHEEGKSVPGSGVPGVTLHGFAGPHPAGLPGTHIHFLRPVSLKRTVWFIGYQDVAAYGHLARTGRWDVGRVVSLAGPGVRQPRLIRTRVGACLDDLTKGELTDGENRVVSGSLLAGRHSVAPSNFLGRYHTQISVLPEGRQREFLGWQMPGRDKFSATRSFAAAWLGTPADKLSWNTSTRGSHRAMVPIGVYEKVVPMDLLPTQLLRALLVGDTDQAQALGCLELDEEDLGLCTFVCPSKYDYGTVLRQNLTTIEREG